MLVYIPNPIVLDLPPDIARRLIEKGKAECLDQMTVVQPLRDRMATKEVAGGADDNR